MATKTYIDLEYLKEFWKRIELIPTTQGSKYTVTLGSGKNSITTNPDTIVGHLKQLYELAADAQAISYNISKTGTYITVSGDGSKNNPWVIDIDGDAKNKIDQAFAAIDTWKGKTTLTGSSNLDLSQGDVVLTLGGDGAAEGQKVKLSKIDISALANVLHVGDAEISGSDKITLTSTAQTGSATIEGENNSSATVSVDASAIFTAISNAEGKIEKLNTLGTSEDGTYVNATVTAATSTDGTGSVTVSVDDSALDDTFLKIANANNEVVSISDVTLEKGAGTTYSGSLSYTDNAGASKTATISFDSADFVKDSFLSSAVMGTGDDANKLILSFNTVDQGGSQTLIPIKVDLAQFITSYTAADKSINITDNTVKVNLTGDYLTLDEASGIKVNTTKLQGYAATETKTGDNNIATKKYVDDAAKNANVSVTATDVTTFGATGTVNIKTGENDTTGTTFTVTLPSFTAGTQDDNVKVSITNGGEISTTVTSQAGDTTHTDTALAQKGYVDQKFDEAKDAVTGGTGTDTDELITVTTAATTAAPTVSATLTEVSGKVNTAIATKEFVEDAIEKDTLSLTSDSLVVTPATAGKAFTIEATVETWSNTNADSYFPFSSNVGATPTPTEPETQG